MGDRKRFEGRVAAVTGGGSGIGRATALRLAREGARVAVVDIDAPSAERVAREIQAEGGVARGMAADVGVEAEVEGAAGRIAEEWGGIHILVNNAAAFIQRGVEAATEDWRRVWQTNVLGCALATRYASRLMREAGGGVIINVASVSGMVGHAGYATYNSSKAAVLNLTQCFAVDLGPHNIRVNSVTPGVTVTPALYAALERAGQTFEELEKGVAGRQCLARLCQPEDVAAAIAFLASEEAAAITGANLVVDGGLMAKR